MASPLDDARAALAAAGTLPDAELDLGAVALQFARIDQPEADWGAAREALSAIARAAAATPDSIDLATRATALQQVLAGFGGDTESYDDPANANLIQVLQRRKGLPVALGILWLHAAEAAGWAACGIDFPGHFLVALLGGERQLLLDVFRGGAPLAAPELRTLLKQMEGEHAELRPGLLAPMGKRAVLLRLQNNLKLRRLRAGDLAGALACTEDMLRLAPAHLALWREAGVMNQRLDRVGAALACLEKALALDPDGPLAPRLRLALDELRQRLN